MTMREIVVKHVAEVVEAHSSIPFPDDMTDETRLADLWLDSVAYTDLISRLEEAVDYIPTVILEGAFYPETIGELVSIYESAAEKRS
jgi:acyl carrier protein